MYKRQDVERTALREESEELAELERVLAIVDKEHTSDKHDKALAVTGGLRIASVDLVLHLLEGQALSSE